MIPAETLGGGGPANKEQPSAVVPALLFAFPLKKVVFELDEILMTAMITRLAILSIR
jgi:hypothetical protein